jgi:hypothetical protein
VSEGRCVDKGEGRMVGLLKTEVEVEAEWRSAPRARERTAVRRRGDWRRRDSAGRDRTAIVPYLRVGGWLDVGEDNRFRSLREDFVLSEVSSIVVQSRVRSDKRDRSPQLRPSDDISNCRGGNPTPRGTEYSTSVLRDYCSYIHSSTVYHIINGTIQCSMNKSTDHI